MLLNYLRLRLTKNYRRLRLTETNVWKSKVHVRRALHHLDVKYDMIMITCENNYNKHLQYLLCSWSITGEQLYIYFYRYYC